jgi:spore coat protein A, manganese oxidase
MKKYLTFNRFIARFAFALSMLFVFAASGFAQLKLRHALDYDGDGKADYGVFRPTTSTWYINKTGGTTLFQQFGLSDYDTLTPGDYDGDGKADLAVWRYTDRVWYVLNSSTGAVSYQQFGLIGDEPVQRDYDGDGKTDIAIVRRTNGVMIWYVQGSTAGFRAYQFGLNTDNPAPGDYDGDGKFDYAVHRPGAAAGAQAYYYINRSGDGGFSIFPWGLYGDVVVPGDYDGDGLTDAAVMRRGATNQAWYVLRSSDLNYVALTFGLTESDFPTQNDYDGDGKTDFSVWRETDGQFYVLRSSDNGLGVVPWGWLSDQPIAGYDAH